jgi:hypothetical protein
VKKERSKKPKCNEAHNQLAKLIANNCYRNTFIEDLHAGIFPFTRTGDYSDVKVIDGEGREIPWKKLSKISDEEMHKLNKQVVNKIYTFLELMNNEAAMRLFSLHYPSGWDDANLDESFIKALELFKKRMGILE